MMFMLGYFWVVDLGPVINFSVTGIVCADEDRDAPPALAHLIQHILQ